MPEAGALEVVGAGGPVLVPVHPGQPLREVLLSAGVAVPSTCGGQGRCGRCAVRVEGDGGPTTPAELRLLSEAQRSGGLRLACQARAQAGARVHAEAWGLAPWRRMRDDEFTPVVLPRAWRRSDARYAVAVDLGTTHLRAALWDLRSGQRLGGRTGLNPQRAFGADILSRLMEASRSPQHAEAVSGLVQRALAQGLGALAADASLRLAEVGEVWVVGNTAMLALLSGREPERLLNPEHWGARLPCTAPEATTLGLDAGAVVRVLQPMGGFVGSDALAGVAACGLAQLPAGSLFLDFGTNTELALWDGQTLHVAAAAGGPAFEGSGIGCGMPGEAGAIFRVRPAVAGAFDVEVLGGGAPLGLCGSGLVDAFASLRADGRLDRVGRLREGLAEVRLAEGPAGPLVLTRRDVDVFQRAKGAIGGGVRCLCARAGLPLKALQRVVACGAFGRLLDVPHAQALGLLPDVPEAAVELQGNTALAGCEAAMLGQGGVEALEALQARSVVLDLAQQPEFEVAFVESLFLEPLRDAG